LHAVARVERIAEERHHLILGYARHGGMLSPTPVELATTLIAAIEIGEVAWPKITVDRVISG
jgi:hypothetical protein